VLLLQQQLEKLGLNWLPSSQLIGIGTDVEANSIGVENGIVQQVQKNLSHVHCPQNVLSAVKNAKCTDDTDSILKLYKFYHFH
jgi:hypothetical protein